MQLARQVPAFRFLQVDQTPRKRLQLPCRLQHDVPGLLAFRDVLCNAADPVHRARLISDRKSTNADPSHRSVRSPDPPFDLKSQFRARTRNTDRLFAFPGANRVQERSRLLPQACQRSSPDFLVGGTHIKQLVHIGSGHPEHLPHVLGELPEFLLTFAQRILGLLSVLDIGRRSVPLYDLPPLVAQRHGADQEPAVFPVRAAKTHFILARFPSSHVDRPFFQDAWKVIGMNYLIRLFQCVLEREARVLQPALIDEINGVAR